MSNGMFFLRNDTDEKKLSQGALAEKRFFACAINKVGIYGEERLDSEQDAGSPGHGEQIFLVARIYSLLI